MQLFKPTSSAGVHRRVAKIQSERNETNKRKWWQTTLGKIYITINEMPIEIYHSGCFWGMRFMHRKDGEVEEWIMQLDRIEIWVCSSLVDFNIQFDLRLCKGICENGDWQNFKCCFIFRWYQKPFRSFMHIPMTLSEYHIPVVLDNVLTTID